MVSTAQTFADVADSWITPWNPFGSPSAWRIQSTILVSISVAAGEVCQSMHCAPMTAVKFSAIIDTGAALAQK